MCERDDQGEVQHDVREHRHDPDPDRRARVLTREVPGREHFDRDEREQTEGEREQRPGRHLHVVGGELPVLEQGGESGLDGQG